MEEFDFPKKKLINVQSRLEKLVSKNFELHVLAKDGFRLVPNAHVTLSPTQTLSMMRTLVRVVDCGLRPRVS